MAIYVTGTKQELRVHSSENCKGPNCVIHNPSDHKMKDFPTHWRDDTGLMERICQHGIGHPDPDALDFIQSLGGLFAAMDYALHGCDGCCRNE